MLNRKATTKFSGVLPMSLGLHRVVQRMQDKFHAHLISGVYGPECLTSGSGSRCMRKIVQYHNRALDRLQSRSGSDRK
jgi:hypothetical protein